MTRLAAFLLALLSSVFIALPALAAGPRMELDPPSWEMGEIYQWTNPSITIKIKNTGDAPLNIKGVKASCGCTAVVISERIIGPGRAGEMKIDFASYNFSGPVNKVVVLSTDDAAAPDRALRIKGLIKPDRSAIGSVEPAYLDLGIVAPYETRYFDVTIKNSGNDDLRITGMDMPEGFFLDSAYPGVVAPLSSQPVRIGYKPSKDSGPIDGEVKVLISHAGQDSLWMRAVGYVGESARGADALIVTPTRLTVQPGAGPVQMEVTLKNSGGDGILVEDADVSFDGATASLSTNELLPGGTGTVGVTLVPSSLKQGARGYLYIRVGVPVIVPAAPGDGAPSAGPDDAEVAPDGSDR
ncbi:MAG: DUF1573 domain-containing protein [Nitrospirae bacterium]|nr:DUF1573 domain-containing protein [Nitrospirota bacterium]